MTNVKRYDPPLKDEEWVGNCNTGDDLSHLKNVKYRTGEQAYDIHGKKLSPSYMLPLYVKKDSYNLYNSIMQRMVEDARK